MLGQNVESLINEGLLPLNEASNLYPRNARGKKPHVSVLHRHATRGLRGVVLETVQAGSKRCTTRAAIARFFARLTDVAQGSRDGSLPSSVVNPNPHLERELDAVFGQESFHA